MENYNNYQDIINAIKAEYVIVRDLKRVANAKKRELNNAQSFVNRKGNEESTLETRITNAKQDALDRANNALGTIQEAINSDYTLDLNASAAKLAFIEAEILKLQNFNISLPEQYEAFTQNELNSINSLKGVLTSAINDVKFIYENDIMESNKFSILKDETKLSTETSNDNSIEAHYNTIVYNVKQLIDSTRQHFADYVSTSSDMENSLIVAKDSLVNRTRELVLAKSELADLLDSNAPQSEIDAQNVQIDALKIQVVEKANELKALHIETELFYTNKHKDFSVYFEVIHSLYEEVENWLYAADAQIFVRYNRRDYRRDIQSYIRKFMEELIAAIEEKIPTANGQSLSSIISEIFESATDQLVNGDQAIENSYLKNQVLSDLDGLSNLDNTSGDFTLSTEVPGRVWSDSFDYLKSLHQNARDYIDAKKHLQVKESTFNSRRMIFDEFFNDTFGTYIPAFQDAYNAHKLRLNEHITKHEGVWTGTPEQENTYSDLVSVRRNLLTDFAVLGYKRDLTASKLSLFSGMFPNFYSEETALKSAKESAISTLDSIQNTMEDMYIVKQAAYDYLQTLTEVDEEYQAAFTAWNDANTEFQSLAAAYDALTPQYNSLVSNLSDVTALYGSSIDSSFVYGTGFDEGVNVTKTQSDGKILVGGYFSWYNGTFAKRIIRLNTDGSVDTSFVYGSGFDATVWSIAIQSDDKILVAGEFMTYNGTSAKKIIRLNSDGSVDTSFDCTTGYNNDVKSIAIQSDGKIVLTGSFTHRGGTYIGYVNNEHIWNGGTSANKIIRLNSDGSVDTSFVYGTGFASWAHPRTLSIQSDGKILVGGIMTGNQPAYNGAHARNIIRLNSDGSVDTAFSTIVNDRISGYGVFAINIQSDGKIILGGSFNEGGIVRLNSDGSLDTSFVSGTGFNDQVRIIAIQSDGKMVVGGDFNQYNGTPANRIIRLITDGSIDTSFVYDAGFNNLVISIAIQSNGKILVGGQFTNYNGTSVNRIVSLNSTVIYNAEYADEFNAATDALNVFIDEVRTPANDAKNDAENVASNTYNFLQTLTEVDEEYQAAFNDWDSKEIAFGEYDRDFKAPATIAANEAAAAYDYHISTENVYDVISSFTQNGSDLIDIKLVANGFATQYDEKQSQLSESQTSLEAIESEMTFIESDLATKLESYGYIDDENTKAYKAAQYWSNLIESNLESLSQLNNFVIQSYSEVINHSPFEVDALQNLKDFLDGNTEYSTNRDIEKYGFSLIFRAQRKNDFSHRVLRNMFDMDENTFENYFRPDNITTDAFKNNPTFLSDKLKSIAQYYRGCANANFAQQVIDFVNTGVWL